MVELELFQMYHLKEMSLSAELFLSCSILQLSFYAISTAYQRKAGFVILKKQVYYIGTLLLILSAFLILNEDLLIMNYFTSNNSIINDYLGFASKLVICLTSIFFLLIVNISFKDEPIQNNFEYVVLITISVLGLLLLCSSNDLITAYLSIELQSVAFYIMSAFKRNSSYSIESGLKYFIIGSLSSAFFLFGSSLIYGCMGSLNFDDLRMFFSLLFSESSLSFNENDYIFGTKLAVVGSQAVSSSDWVKVTVIYLASIDLSAGSIAKDFGAIGSSSQDNLIDWCYENFKDETSLSFLAESNNTLTTLSNQFENLKESLIYFGVLALPSRIMMDLCGDTYMEEAISYSFESQISECFTLDASLLNSKLIILKQIFVCYNESLFGIKAGELSSLNLDLVSIGFILICISILIKLSIAPFHFWSLDVYEGSPNTTTFFFAVVPKIGLFILLTRLCYVSFYHIFVNGYQIYFFILAVFSVFVGSFGGLEQRKLKTLLAYSSVSHTGYLLLSFSTGNLEGMQMMFYYLVIYMVSGLCFWSVYLFLRQKRNIYFNKSNKELGDLVLLRESNPMLALILALTLFSIAGIPPIVGFLAKLGIFLVVVKSSAYLIAVLSIVFSVVSTFYYIRLIKILYFENTLVGKLYIPVTTQKALLVAVLALLLIILCINPTIIYLLFYKATLLAS